MMTASGRIPIYVLGVDDTEGPRRQHVEQEFERLNYSFTFVEGLRAADPQIWPSYSRWRNFFCSKRSLSATEIAVYLGHRRIWRAIASGADEVALVAEDDLSITDPAAFADVMRHASDHAAWDILKLFDFAPKPVVHRQDWHGLEIVDYKYPASGCVAYLVTRDAARRLLARRKIFRPVDEDLSWCWEFALRVRSISPNICTEVSHRLGGSLIEESRVIAKRQSGLVRSLVAIVIAGLKQVRARRYLVRITARGPAEAEGRLNGR